MGLKSTFYSIRNWAVDKVLDICFNTINKIIGGLDSLDIDIIDPLLEDEEQDTRSHAEIIPILTKEFITDSLKVNLTQDYKALLMTTSTRDYLTLCIKVVDKSSGSKMWLPFYVDNNPAIGLNNIH